MLPFILAESIKADLALSDTQMGLLTGLAFAVCYALLSPPLTRASDRGSSAPRTWSPARARNPGAVGPLFDANDEAFGGADVVVNNAGIMNVGPFALMRCLS
jgi:NAD(P)-dependent dehydrogenase (short-subunit alcohol dehydrogenase family)